MDVGGTFTDAVLAGRTGVFTAKVPTTPGRPVGGRDGGGRASRSSARASRRGDVASFGHGMTVATNALLEERGARTALLATEGFTDVIELARQTRPELYRPCRARPAPLVPRGAALAGASSACEPGGVAASRSTRRRSRTSSSGCATRDVESVAICLLHSYAHPEHERRVAAAVAERAARTCTSPPRTSC